MNGRPKKGAGSAMRKKTVPEEAGICQTWFRTVMFPVFRRWENTVLWYMWVRDFHGEGCISAPAGGKKKTGYEK